VKVAGKLLVASSSDRLPAMLWAESEEGASEHLWGVAGCCRVLGGSPRRKPQTGGFCSEDGFCR
jgi:hypothetical protein